jgi:hypothetical protein
VSEDKEIDLRDRLRFAADALAADCELTADRAEALVFSSAEGLLASASVMEFVPIFAERRARQAVRTGVASPGAAPAQAPAAAPPPAPVPPPASTPPAAPTPPPPAPTPPPAAPTPPAAAPAPPPAVAGDVRPEPLLAVPEEQIGRLRDGVELVRGRLNGWQAELSRR